MGPIPFLPLREINLPYENTISEALARVRESGIYLLGDELHAFETEWATYCGTRFAIGVGSGLDALWIVLEAWKELGYLKLGDEVLVPAQTYFACFLAVQRAGLVPIPVDIQLPTAQIDLADAERALSARTKAIMAVHLYGLVAPMREIREFASAKGLLVLEDGAQAHGARDASGACVGAMGDAAAFSFYPTKVLGCMGDGGAITTDDQDFADLVRKIRNYGTSSKYHHEVTGFNSRLDEFQAAILRTKLAAIEHTLERHRAVAGHYLEALSQRELTLPAPRPGELPAWHLFVVTVPSRERFRERLVSEFQIETMVHYPILPSDQPACLPARSRATPTAERHSQECVSLPCHAMLLDSQVSQVIQAVQNLIPPK
ncbi:MAG: DegT/DnrJ/EryC1/StrS family aminotransferase [Planctomycetaceae bacterium]|nr:DegT/DnrJ/EryC1/StrS family aminotransferase [Planctomycetales bacterium]MCB9922486.1 DegT/DnrJ/EryC1/StrS family aminotransferase [Planctomycetaceae bacterium]